MDEDFFDSAEEFGEPAEYHDSIYEEEEIERLVDDDALSDSEAGFMMGYNEA